jgi:nicotinate-nucleotide adenylyltransferase
MAFCAHEQFSLDQVWLMPAGHSPNKDEGAMTKALYRMRMCELAAQAYDWLSVSSLEIDAPEKSFTYRTLEKLHAAYPSDEFFFIMGGDSFGYLDKWVHPEIIASLSTILVIPRDRFSIDVLEQKAREIQSKFPCRAHILSCEMYPISSTQLRRQLRDGRVEENRIPADVLTYIRQNNIYFSNEWGSMIMDIIEIRKKVKKDLDKSRYEHTKGVMYTAGSLAMAYGYDYNKAMLAGLLHDCAKCLSTSEKLSLCKKHHILVTSVELENPGLLHAKAGMVLAEEKYHIKDPEILHAIKVHTTGEPNMNLLDKIIYVADYIEPLRCDAPHLEEIRRLAFSDLDRCVAVILYDTLHYLDGRKGSIDPTTKITYDYYQQYYSRKE